MLNQVERGAAVALCCVGEARIAMRAVAAFALAGVALLAGCSDSASVTFSIRNECATPISVGLRPDSDLKSSVTTVTAEVAQTRIYKLSEEPHFASISVIVIPTNGELSPSVNTRPVALDDLAEGAGTSGDPYVIVVDGDLCSGG